MVRESRRRALTRDRTAAAEESGGFPGSKPIQTEWYVSVYKPQQQLGLPNVVVALLGGGRDEAVPTA